MQSASSLHVFLFGRMSIKTATGSPVRISSRKGRALIAYVAMAPDLQVGREELAHLLWGDRTDGQARQSLRQCIIRLRRELGPSASLLVSTTEHVAIDRDGLWVDAVEFQSCAASQDTSDIERALRLYRDAFLRSFDVKSDPFTCWADAERERMQRLATQLMEAGIEEFDAAGEGRKAIALAEHLTMLDPLREDWQRSLLRLYARYNCREVALQHAECFRAQLKDELGVAPEAATKNLIESIFRNEFEPAGSKQKRSAGSGDVSSLGLNGPINTTPTAWSPGDENARVGYHPARPKTDIKYAVSIGLGSLGVAILLALSLGRDGVTPPVHAPDVVIEQAASAHSYPISVQVLPFTIHGSTDAGHDLSQRLRNDLADRLSLFSGFEILSVQSDHPSSTVVGARYRVGGEIRTEGIPRITLRLINGTRRVLVDQAQLPSNSVAYDELMVRWSRKLQVMMILYEGRAARASGQTSESRELRKGQAAYLRGISRETYSEAVTAFEGALRLNPESVPAMVGIASQLLTGGANFVAVQEERGHQLDRAERLLQRAVELESRSEVTYFWIGQVHNGRRDFELALRAFERSLELNPNFVPSIAGYGNILARMGRHQEGIDLISQAVRLAPDDPAVGTWMAFWGAAEIEQGNDEFARELLLLASQKAPGNARVVGLLAAAAALCNDFEAATRHLAKFQSLAGARSLDSAVNRMMTIAGVDSRLAKGLATALRESMPENR